jgi:hypothetical protein
VLFLCKDLQRQGHGVGYKTECITFMSRTEPPTRRGSR